MMNQLRSRLDESGARTALVRGATPPPRPPETVTVAPGVVATVGLDGHHAPLFVTAESQSGRTVRRYDGRDASAAADCAAELTDQHDPEAVWLCEREQIRSWWGDGVVTLLERRLGEAAREADARLVVWTSETDGAIEPGGSGGAGESDGSDGAVESARSDGAVESGGTDGPAVTVETGDDALGPTDENGAVEDRYDVVVDP